MSEKRKRKDELQAATGQTDDARQYARAGRATVPAFVPRMVCVRCGCRGRHIDARHPKGAQDSTFADKEFPLAQAKAAHEYSETGRARGKIILRVI